MSLQRKVCPLHTGRAVAGSEVVFLSSPGKVAYLMGRKVEVVHGEVDREGMDLVGAEGEKKLEIGVLALWRRDYGEMPSSCETPPTLGEVDEAGQAVGFLLETCRKYSNPEGSRPSSGSPQA
ncbi:hypothetical protein DNTS_013625 [Danionella cerebrum]|uniref:Uncharacterized protein n=1 Tax=Danionella cerebrum TaxID=2873325 RepID=A0A553QCL6_9TELE|nr:hypothetical protein DNTS_013625 [Danionella translucida]